MNAEQAMDFHERLRWNQHCVIILIALVFVLWLVNFVWRVRVDALAKRRREASDKVIADNAAVNVEVRDLLTVVKGILAVTTHQRDQTVRAVDAAVCEVKAAAAGVAAKVDAVAAAVPASESGTRLRTLPPESPGK